MSTLPDNTDQVDPKTGLELDESTCEEFQDTKPEPTPALQEERPAPRRLERIRKRTGEWWKDTGNYAQALAAPTVPTSYLLLVMLKMLTKFSSLFELHDFC